MSGVTGVDETALARSIGIFLTKRAWRRVGVELARRGSQQKESGAFFLACSSASDRKVRRIVFYDDLDPHCLTGGISFSHRGYDALWEVCRTEQLRVVADVHTHPSAHVKQSDVDKANPMISTVGHIAVIVPNYGVGAAITDTSVNVYLGKNRWSQHYGKDAANVLRPCWGFWRIR